jgi:hypothetical protein
MASIKIRLRDKFFTVNLSFSSSAEVKSASAAIAPKRGSVVYLYLYSLMMELFGYKRVFSNFTGMLGRSAAYYADGAP